MTRALLFWLVVILAVCSVSFSIGVWTRPGKHNRPLELNDVIHVNKINAPENMPQRERLIAVMTSALNVLTQIGRAVDPTVEQVPQNEPYSTNELENRLANLTASILLLQVSDDIDTDRLKEQVLKSLQHKRDTMVHQNKAGIDELISAYPKGAGNESM